MLARSGTADSFFSGASALLSRICHENERARGKQSYKELAKQTMADEEKGKGTKATKALAPGVKIASTIDTGGGAGLRG